MLDVRYREARAAQKRGDLGTAEAVCRSILDLDYAHVGALQILGVIAAQRGEQQSAAAYFRRVLEACPDDAAAHCNFAIAQLQLGETQAAASGFERAIALDPDFSNAHANLGKLMRTQGRLEDALASLDRWAAIQTGNAAAHFECGLTLSALGRHKAAVAAFRRVFAIRADYPGLRFQLGNALWVLRMPVDALAEYDAVIAADPQAAGAIANRSVVLIALGRPAEAFRDMERALELKPDNPDFWNLHGNALHALNRHLEAVDSYSKALKMFPSHRDAEFNISMCCLVTGDFGRGWKAYESRWKTDMNLGRLDFSEPQWNGEKTGRKLLVWGEQGIGDEILHLGLLDALLERAPRVTIAVMPRLLPLLRRSYPGTESVSIERIAGLVFDEQIPMGSLGRYLRKSYSDFPQNRKAYLAADPGSVEKMRARVRQKGSITVGLSWVSHARLFGNLKTMPLLALRPLLSMPQLRFVDLQYDDTARERSEVAAVTGMELLHLDDVDAVNDMDGLAALICACDVVVTISNTTAHLAGALGVPVLLMLPYSSGRQWYWHDGRPDSPWYPSMQLFRQQASGQWDSVIDGVCDAVRSIKAKKGFM